MLGEQQVRAQSFGPVLQPVVQQPTRYLGQAPTVIHLPGCPGVAKAVHDWEKAILPNSVASPADGLRSATAGGEQVADELAKEHAANQ